MIGGGSSTAGGSSTVAAALAAALAAVRSGRSVAVSGRSGSGVSHVLRRFVAEAGPELTLAFDPTDVVGPAVLVLDDAQHLDVRTGEALARRLLAGEHVVVLGATAPSPVVHRLRSTGDLLAIELGPLDDDAIAALVADATGGVPDAATTRALAADSGGLPGYLVPTVEAAAREGSLVTTAGIARLRGPLPLPAAVVDRVVGPLDRLSDDATRVVQGACVGRELPIEGAADAFGLDALAEAERVGLLAVGDTEQTIRPAAGAVARVVRAQLGRFGAAGVARWLIEALPAAPTARRVHWRVLAGERPDTAELVEAASAAQQRGELSVALDLAGRAAREGDHRAALLLAEVTAAVGDRADAAEVLEGLLADPGIDPELRAAGALELATLNLWNLGRPDRAIELAQEVASITRGSAFEAVGRAALGAMLTYTGRCAEAVAVVEPCLDEETPGHALSCQVASASLAVIGSGERGVAVGRRGLQHSETTPSGPGAVDPEIHVVSLALALELSGHLTEADALTSDWYERAATRSVHHAWVALARSRVMLVLGRLVHATLFAREAATIFGDLDNHAPRRWAVAAHLLAASQLTDRAAVQSCRDELDALGPSGVTFLDGEIDRARIWSDAALGHLDRARREMQQVAGRAGDAELFALAANAWHDVIRLGGNADVSALVGLEGKVDGALMRVRAHHAQAIGADDVAELVEAARAYGALGAALYGAEAAAQAATRAEHARDRGAARRATAVLRELAHECPDAATPLLLDVPIAELSPRERDVARLAASGLTSREIGERLALSVRTVDNLLQRAYVKLGVRNRRELPSVIDPAPD